MARIARQASSKGPPPWNIGEPQPELAALAAAGKFRSDRARRRMRVRRVVADAGRRGLHRARRRPDPDRGRRRHQGRRGARAEQRHASSRPTSPRSAVTTAASTPSSTARCSIRCRSRAATVTCVRCTARPPTGPATSCWYSPRARSRRMGAEAERGRRGRVTGRGQQVLADRRDPAGLHSRASSRRRRRTPMFRCRRTTVTRRAG